MRIGLGCGLGFASMLAADLEFYPSQVPGCVAFWDPAKLLSLTYGATLKATGTSPPAVTLTGSPLIVVGIYIDIEAGATTFRWSLDSGATFVQSGVTIPLGGTHVLGATGFTANFPNSAYNADNLYESTISNWASQVGTNPLVQATAAAQGRLIAGVVNGRPGLRLDGVDDTYRCTTIDRPAPTAGTSTFYWGVVRLDSNTSNDAMICAPSASSRIVVLKNAASGVTLNNGAASSAQAITTGTLGRLYAHFSNTTADAIKWQAGAETTGTATGGFDPPAGIDLGSRQSTATTFSADTWLALGIWDNKPSAGNLAALDAWVTATFGAGLV